MTNETSTTMAISQHWLERAAELHDEFVNARPFPMVVMDDFLDPDAATALLDEFPSLDAMPKSRDYIFGDKHELSSVAEVGPAGRAYADTMLSGEFASFLQTVTGIDELFVDPSWHGGGYHQGADGSYLDMHVDFNVHPIQRDWLRRVNVLLYLNRDWADAYGGELLVKAAVDDEPVAIAPRFNRAVIMVTDDGTFHGYRRMSLPAGVTRRSIATYAYTADAADVKARTTGWVPDDAGSAKRFAARYYDTAVRWKNRVFGSSTAKNR